MWGDFIFISPLVAIIVTSYSAGWSSKQIFIAFTISLFLSFGIHRLFYLTRPFAGFWGFDGKLSTSGAFHFAFMTFAMAVFELLYLATPDADRFFLSVVSVLLASHAIMSKAGQLLLRQVHPELLPAQAYEPINTWLPIILSWIVIFVFWENATHYRFPISFILGTFRALNARLNI
jgi:hypothetical protein